MNEGRGDAPVPGQSAGILLLYPALAELEFAGFRKTLRREGGGRFIQPEWWHWAVGGIALILAELAVPAFVLIWFGLGGLVVALLVAVLPQAGLTMQMTVWLLVSVGFVAVWFRFFKPNFHKTRIGMSESSLIGEIGLLTREVAPFQKGEVRFQKPMIGSEIWPCIADVPIAAGERVKVLGVEGSLLQVGKI